MMASLMRAGRICRVGVGSGTMEVCRNHCLGSARFAGWAGAISRQPSLVVNSAPRWATRTRIRTQSPQIAAKATVAATAAGNAAKVAAVATSESAAVSARKALGFWMAGLSGAVFGMVAVGGYTRLTRSGLSMTEWRLTGSKLPSTPEEWAIEFEKYKAFPEYQKLNQGMNLEEFKSIYFWEWFHRMWGRSLGVLFAVPAAYFVSREQTRSAISKLRLYPRLALLFTLGGTQGLVGWWMVKSGLDHTHVFGFDRPESDMPRVSPYRLATHLSFAFVTYGLLSWTSMDLLEKAGLKEDVIHRVNSMTTESLRRIKTLRRSTAGVCALLGVTIFSGAFVAGNLAGLAYNDWPLMGGKFVPDEIHSAWNMYTPRIRNAFENVAMVQFDHRMLAYSTLVAGTSVCALVHRMSSIVPPATIFRANCLTAMVWTQAALGVATILYNVPVELGVLHQAGALTAWTLSIWLAHSLKHFKYAQKLVR